MEGGIDRAACASLAADTTTASYAAIRRPAVFGVSPGANSARGMIASNPPAAALGPGGSGSTSPFVRSSPGLVSMDALVAAVKAALPERATPGESREPQGGSTQAGSSELRMALQRRHAALFVLQECGQASPGDTAMAAMVHVNQFRKCRVALPKLGEN